MDRYLSSIDKVTAADVQRVAKRYLVDENCTLGVLVPTGILPHEVGGGGGSGTVHHAPMIRTDASAEFEPRLASARPATASGEVAR
jgi:hypothetical protein